MQRYSWGHFQDAGQEYGRRLSPLSCPHPPSSSASPGPIFSRTKPREGFSGLLAQVPSPTVSLIGPDLSHPVLKGPTRIVALLRKRKFFS